jgi:hypothetical protein
MITCSEIIKILVMLDTIKYVTIKVSENTCCESGAYVDSLIGKKRDFN